MGVMVTLASAPALVDVRVEMNDHETMTVELHETSETRHLATYGSECIRGALTLLSEDARVPVKMVRAGSCSNVWETIALHGRQTPPANQSVRTAN